MKILWERLLGRREPRAPKSYQFDQCFHPEKQPYILFLSSVFGGQVLEARGLIEGIKPSIWGSCLSLRLFLFCNNRLFSVSYLFFPSTLRNDEVTGPR